MQMIEQWFFFAAIIVFVNFIIGLFQEYAPEALPPILRRKEMKTYMTTIIYDGPNGITSRAEEMQGNSLDRMEYAVLDELNKKKFISLGGGLLIPTNSIMQVTIKEVVLEKAGE
jgi:hypothetical protein